MKTSIKYLLIAAVVAFSFLKVFSNKNERVVIAQPPQAMPQIPNGDFEDWENEHTYMGLNELKNWKTNSIAGSSSAFERRIIKRDSINVYHGKYSAKFLSAAWAKNKFPVSVHPNTLHGYVRCMLGERNGESINVKLLKNGLVVGSGEWKSTITLNDWTELVIPITSTSSEVDTAVIMIQATQRLWVDNLFFK